MFARAVSIGLMMFAGSALAVPEIQHWKTQNGARVYFVEARELPIVDVQIVFDAAGARDGTKPGLARLTNGLLAEGAGGFSADRIAERFAELGAEFGNSSLRDMATVSLRSLSHADKLRPALELVGDILAEPTQAIGDRHSNEPAADDREFRLVAGYLHYHRCPNSRTASISLYFKL